MSQPREGKSRSSVSATTPEPTWKTVRATFVGRRGAAERSTANASRDGFDERAGRGARRVTGAPYDGAMGGTTHALS